MSLKNYRRKLHQKAHRILLDFMELSGLFMAFSLINYKSRDLTHLQAVSAMISEKKLVLIFDVRSRKKKKLNMCTDLGKQTGVLNTKWTIIIITKSPRNTSLLLKFCQFKIFGLLIWYLVSRSLGSFGLPDFTH